MSKTTQPQPTTRRARLKTWTARLFGIVFGLALAWLVLEIGLRLAFFSLPPRQQLILTHVRQHPFTDARMLPDPIWQSDTDYLTINRAVTDYDQFGSAEVHFTVDTEALWGGRVAFRTRQELVDRYVDAVAVGDSFTFCFTELEDCWVTRLSERADRNVINMGITSTGSLSHLRVLQDYGLPLTPPLVIWQWFGNDANEDYGLAVLRGETDIANPNPPFPVPERGWWDENSAVYTMLKYYLGPEEDFDASLQFLDPEHASSGDVDLAFGQPYLWGAFDTTQPHNQYGWERSQAALRKAQSIVSEYGGTLLVVLMPTKEQVYRSLSEPLLGAEKIDLLQASYDQMRAFCAEEDLYCLDLLVTLQANADEQLYYTTDMHLNARGNEVLAEALANWIAAHQEVFELPAS